MRGNGDIDLEAVERLQGVEWFWMRTLWEIRYQPVMWACCVLLGLALLAVVVWLIVYVTGQRRPDASN